MEITSSDWYRAKDVKKDQESRGRRASALHYLMVAIMCANEEHLTEEQLCDWIYQINSYRKIEPESKEEIKKRLGF